MQEILYMMTMVRVVIFVTSWTFSVALGRPSKTALPLHAGKPCCAHLGWAWFWARLSCERWPEWDPMDGALMASGPIGSVLSHCFVWWAQHGFLRGADFI